ncbi:unnamed protein product [Heterobilharzia americana]|nr:unnamed protein product [Heterobilharzia americana]
MKLTQPINATISCLFVTVHIARLKRAIFFYRYLLYFVIFFILPELPNHINPTDSSCQPKLHTNDKIGSIHSLPIIENVNCGSDETKVETAGMTVVDGSAESPPTVSSVNTDKSLSSSRTPVKPLCKSSSMMNSKTHSTHVVHCPYFPVVSLTVLSTCTRLVMGSV